MLEEQVLEPKGFSEAVSLIPQLFVPSNCPGQLRERVVYSEVLNSEPCGQSENQRLSMIILFLKKSLISLLPRLK